MGRGKAIGNEAREIIYKVYLYFAVEAEKFKTDDRYFQKIQHRVASATGVSLKFIYLLLKEKGKFGSDSLAINSTTKRKLDGEDYETNVPNDNYIIPDIEPVRPDPLAEKKGCQIEPKSMLERVLTAPHSSAGYNTNTSPVNVVPRFVEVNQIHQTTASKKGKTVVTPRKHPTGLIPIKPKPAVVPVPKPTTILNSTLDPPQNYPGPTIIKVHSLAPTVVPKQLVASVSTVVTHKPREPRPEFIKVFQIPRESVPKTVLETANKVANRQNIQIQTVPIEFDPGSFLNEIKTEPKDSVYD